MICSAVMAVNAFAHTYWVTAQPASPGEKAVIVNGYGEDFPVPETISEKRLPFLPPPELIGSDGKKIPLTSGKENYLFETTEPVKKGTYMVVGEYTPVIWTKTKENGWEIKPKNQVSGAIIESYQTAYFTTGVYNVGGAADTELVTKPLGRKIELVPQTNPATLKVGDKLRLQLLFDGKPLANVPVTARAEGYGTGLHNIKAYQNTTDKAGYVDFIPWKAGAWQLDVHYETVPADTSERDIDYWNTTLTFIVDK
jgi:uncharacterized GH25 family protein